MAFQVSLLKGGCTELMILRSVVNFDSEQNAWQVDFRNLFPKNDNFVSRFLEALIRGFSAWMF